MSCGIVIENGKRHVIVMMPDGQFRKVPTNKQPKIGEEITFSERARLRRPRALYSIGVAAAAVMLLLFIPFLVKEKPADSQVVAYLTMDINPSIELGVNKDEQVEELHAINKDGEAVTANLTYKGLPVEQVAEAIMDRVNAGRYIKNGEGDIVITSVLVAEDQVPAYEKDLQVHVDAAVRKALAKTDNAENQHVKVTTLSVPKEVWEAAKAAGISSGKMSFYLLAKSQGHHITIDELKTHSIHQLAEAWGGVQTVIHDSKSDDSDMGKKEDKKEEQKELKKDDLKEEVKEEIKKEKNEYKKEDKQKEQLKKLLKEEKKQEKSKKEFTTNKVKLQPDKSDQNKNNSGQSPVEKVSEESGQHDDKDKNNKGVNGNKDKKNDDKQDDLKKDADRENALNNNEKHNNNNNGDESIDSEGNDKVEGQKQNSSPSPSSAVKEESKHEDRSSDKNEQKKGNSKK